MIAIPNIDSISQSLTFYGTRVLNGTTVLRSLDRAESIIASDAFLVHITPWLEASVNIQTEDSWQSRFNTYVASGSTFAAPPDDVDIATIKNGKSNEDFERRRKAGEIIVSDYETGVATVRYVPGLKSPSKGIWTRSVQLSTLVSEGILSTRFINGQSEISFGETFLIYAPKSQVAFSFTSTLLFDHEWVYYRPFNAASVLQGCRNHNPDTTSQITKTLANANRKSVDVLTAFAEAPKTILSVIGGIKSVVGILRDAKKGNVNISKAYAKRDKLRNKQYLARMRRLDAELSSKNLSKSRRKKLTLHRDKVFVNHRDYMLRTADELASALADVWLTYRYEIMTNVYLAQDIHDAILKSAREWITARITVREDISIPVGSLLLKCELRLKTMIKRSFSKQAAERGQTVLGSDIFVTAWELVPLSFVYDWFINIGDLLQAQVYAKTWDYEGSTLSQKYTIDDVEQSPDDANEYVIQPRVIVRGSYYKRTVINPLDHCGLVWQPNLGLERYLDLVSLSWRPVRSLLHKGKQR